VLAYREAPPPPGLEAFVACVWRSHDGPVRVLPDACVDVVWSDGNLVVAGPATREQIAPATPGRPRAGVRFRVGAAGAALGLPVAELLDDGTTLAALWGRAGARLNDRVAMARDPLAALIAGLGERLQDLDGPDPLVRAAAVALANDGASVEQAGRAVALSERQLRRRFDAAIGYGPATLVRVQRFQRFLHATTAQPEAPLAWLAAEAGYADQAHLARECRRLSGLPPSALLDAGAGPAGDTTGSFKPPVRGIATMAA
jgi:AraC-like DNA-binding protein